MAKRLTKAEFEAKFNQPLPLTEPISEESRERFKRVDEEIRDIRSKSSENKLQNMCVEWFRLKYPDVKGIAHCKNAYNQYGQHQANSAGYTAGYPDLVIDSARRGFHGLRIEFKTPKGSVSKEQKEMHAYLAKEGYLVKVIKTYEDFKNLIEWYYGENVMDG